MKFDSNLAWRQASASVTTNRDVLAALSGVFFLLPSLAIALLFPEPMTNAGMGQQELTRLTIAYYTSVAPFFFVATLIQAFGSQAIILMLSDKSRPTVGVALKAALARTLVYLAAQILFGLSAGLVLGIAASIGAATGVMALTVLLISAAIAVAIWCAVRISLVAPVVAIERVRNPLGAIVRSWRLTRGNAGRLLAFYALVFVAFMVTIVVAMAAVQMIASLVAGAEVARVVGAVVSSILGAGMTVYLIAILAAAHRQLAGLGTDTVSATFE